MGKYDRGMLGKKHSEETRKKISDASKKLWGDKKYRERVIVSQTGENSSCWKGGYALKNIPTYDEYKDRISYAEETRRNKNNSNILEVKCTYCGKWFVPRRIDVTSRIRALEGQNQGECRLYCSDNCKKECPIYKKVLHYGGTNLSREVQAELRQMCFKRDNYTCKKCNKNKNETDIGLHCHHVEGLRWEPLESADIDKVITLCKDCHHEVHKLPDCGYNDMRCK